MPSRCSLSALSVRRHPGILVLLAAELLFLVFVFYGAFRPLPAYHFAPGDLEDWTVNTPLVFDEEGRMGVGTAGTGVDETLFSTPALTLPAGFYRATVQYRTELWFNEAGRPALPTLAFYTEEKNTLCTYEGSLNPYTPSQVLDLWAQQPCTDARMLLKGNGSVFYLQSLDLTPNRPMMAVLAFGALLLVAAGNWVLLRVWQGSSLALGPTAAGALLGVLAITFVACIPLFQANGGLGGHDAIFHMQRIDAMAHSLGEGEFPVRIYHQAKNGYGYAPSLFYGELLLYLPALLRLLGCELSFVYHLYVAGITLATAAVTYACLREILGRRGLALLGCALYLLAPYRLVCVYVRAAVGEYSAFLFLPLIALGLWRLYALSAPKPAWGILCIGFGGLLQTHLITLLLACLTAACVGLVLWRRTFRPFVLLQWARAAVACAAVNLWFLLPFVGVVGNRNPGETPNIAAEALSLAQLFTEGETAIFGLALPLGAALLVGALLMLPAAGRARRPALCALAVGIVCLWASTRLFPWAAVGRIPVLGGLLQSIQFPWRFLGLATLSLTLASLFALQLLGQARRGSAARAGGAALLALTVLFCTTFLPQQVSRETTSYYGDPSQWMVVPASTLTIPMDDLYLPKGAVVQQAGYLADPPVDLTVSAVQRAGRTTTVDCAAGQAQGFVELPLLYYPGYRTDTGTLYPSAHGLVGLAVPAGFEGTVTVTWQEPRRWLAADLVSVVSAAALLAGALYRRRSLKKA